MTRTRLITMGDRGELVRLDRVSERAKPFVVTVGTSRKQWSFAARGEAEQFIASKRWRRSTMTQRAMWIRFQLEESRGLAEGTLRSYEQGWRRWEAFVGKDSLVDETTAQQVYGFPRALEAQELATATIRTTLGSVRAVFGWAKRLELITENRWRDYRHRTAAERRTKQRAEYRIDDFKAIWNALSPADAREWRAWGVVGLLGLYGTRPSEILNLRWSWIDAEAGTITIPAEFVKTRESRQLPLMPVARAVLEIAALWRFGAGADAHVFPGRNGKPYGARDFSRWLLVAEQRAGVPHIRFRSGHAFRRGVVGDLADATGDVSLALLAVGDRNLGMAKHYRVQRTDSTTAPLAHRADSLATTENLQAIIRRVAASMPVQPGAATCDEPATVSLGDEMTVAATSSSEGT